VPGLEKYVFIETGDKNGVSGPHLVFRGVNVHIQSGFGATVDTTTHLGNLIIGYNERPSGNVGVNRSGSHNLVGGNNNEFNSSGGLVFGTNNKLFGPFSSILGGDTNSLTGMYSTVYGGQFNGGGGIRELYPPLPVLGN
jgi:hypothetical protein